MTYLNIEIEVEIEI